MFCIPLKSIDILYRCGTVAASDQEGDMKTPQIPALPGMTPLGIKPRDTTKLLREQDRKESERRELLDSVARENRRYSR